MALLIGTDEAGYGPNLGPLVIGASAWRVPDELDATQLSAALAHCITDEPHDRPTHVPLADSKALYQPSRGLGVLEAATLAAWRCAGLTPESWAEVWTCLAANAADQQLAWHAAFDAPLPHVACPKLLAAWAACLASGLEAADIQFTALRACVVHPAEFNTRVNALGSKGALLSEATLQLSADIIRDSDEKAIFVTCDKHGGRDRYSAVLLHVFPEAELKILQEGRAESRYRLRVDGRTLEYCFQAKGERFLPAALASMTAKYLRELAMAAFNAFWLQRIPGLKPTAGYPLDAARFRREIAATAAPLGFAEHLWWRQR